MQNIIKEAPGIAKGFRTLTESIDEFSSVDLKTKELILLGIFTANRALRGIDTHVRLALEYGANKNEIISAIMYAMPIVGIASVTLCLEKALEIIEEVTGTKE